MLTKILLQFLISMTLHIRVVSIIEYLSCNVNLDNKSIQDSMVICKQLTEFTTQRYTDEERLSFLSDKLCIL